MVLNLPAGSVLPGPRPVLGQYQLGYLEETVFPSGAPCLARPAHYGIADTDMVEVPIIGLFAVDWDITDTLRAFAIDLI